MYQKHNKVQAGAVVGGRRTGGAPMRSGWIKDGGMARLAVETVRKSRSGFKKTQSKPPKTRSTTRIFGKAVDSDREGLNGNGLSGNRLGNGLGSG